MPSFDVITFGETMLRLSPPGHSRLETAETLDCRVGGSESNTAVGLARLGRQAAWWSKLPKSPLGRKVEASIRRWGVDTSLILWTEGGRVGVYYIEFGALPRPHQVYYDRAHSAVSTLSPDEVDWSMLDSARHLHLTGITPALSESCAATTARAAQEARGRGLTVSFDVNYRSKLWSPTQARDTVVPILKDVDLLFCPTGDAAAMFNLHGTPAQTARTLQQKLGVKTIVVTGNRAGVEAVDGEQALRADVIPTTEIDRVGAGDAGNAGILHGYIDGDLATGLRYGSAMAALKHTMPGDEILSSLEEIEAVVGGVSAGIHR
jgi:2-dehydro-3-deoxygluconokinase